MELVIYPDNLIGKVTAFFTGREPGADIERLSQISGIVPKNIYMPKQEHTSEVMTLEDDLSVRVADAVVSKCRGILIGVQVADCVPVLMFGEGTGTIAAVHAGWRGTADGILKNTIRIFLEGNKPDDIQIAIGPAIRSCCYEVGRDVLDKVFSQTGNGDYYKEQEGSLCLDLPSANRHQGISMGIPPENIWMSDLCTFCYPEKFYSYRYSNGNPINAKGRQGGFIALK